MTEVSANRLSITYPEGGSDSEFVFYVSPSLAKRDVASWSDIQGVDISVSGNAADLVEVTFAGRYGGDNGPYYDHNYWRFEHTLPEDFTGVPELIIEFE